MHDIDTYLIILSKQFGRLMNQLDIILESRIFSLNKRDLAVHQHCSVLFTNTAHYNKIVSKLFQIDKPVYVITNQNFYENKLKYYHNNDGTNLIDKINFIFLGQSLLNKFVHSKKH